MISTLFCASLLAADAQALEADHFSLGLPAEADVVGLAFGVHPELLWRPFDPAGRFHVRAATGAMVGPELALVPVSLGFRQMLRPEKTFRLGFGAGLQFQAFLPYGHAMVPRLDQYYEFYFDVATSDSLRVTAALSPEFGWVGGFGLGMAARLGVQMDFPLRD